ncbi:MAG TPA: sulfatase [Geminicoccaceae bacterium]|mgnify:CR=1 FL=1|nr:sulfatase [Geminicoccus sp.]HMU48609.1 sulfatase [Geminicoccaceae bacterium]
MPPYPVGKGLRGWLAGLVIWLLLAWPGAVAARPSFVFILVDDMDHAALQWMPWTRQLIGGRGLDFQRAYVEVALCAPSRASYLTGRYAHNSGVLTVDNANGGYRQWRRRGHERHNLATALHAAGYRTALVGKYQNGFPDNQPETYIPPGWDYWAVAVQRGDAPYRQFNYKLNVNGSLVRYGSSAAAYGTDVYAGKAKEFIRQSAAANKDFFLFLSLFAPHSPSTAAPRHDGLFPDGRVPRTPSFTEKDVSDKPSFLRGNRLGQAAVAALDRDYAQRLRALQAVDEAVRSIYATLQAAGRLDDTYVVFASDNGYHGGHHQQPAGKQLPYEEDIRVPLLIRGPAVTPGRTDRDHLVGNIDLAPTIAQLAGIPALPGVDGRSFAGLLGGGGKPAWREALKIARWRSPSATSDPLPAFRGVRTTRYTWVEWANGERELYDNLRDPHQLANLVADPASAGRRAQLARLAADLASCAGAACRKVENRPWVEPAAGTP